MESVAAIFVLLVALFVVFESGTLSAGVAGLALTYALQVSGNCSQYIEHYLIIMHYHIAYCHEATMIDSEHT